MDEMEKQVPFRERVIREAAATINGRVAAVFDTEAPEIASAVGVIRDLAGGELPPGLIDERARILVKLFERAGLAAKNGTPTASDQRARVSPALPHEFEEAISTERSKMDDDDVTVLHATYQLQKDGRSQMRHIYDRAKELGFSPDDVDGEREYERARTILRRWRETEPAIVEPIDLGNRTKNYYAIVGTEHPHADEEAARQNGEAAQVPTTGADVGRLW